jgi:uncharacterized SAM-binding protein YcdF (DUF218 family)
MLTADAIVVLGCRIEPSGRPAAAASRRAAAAASAFQSGVAPLVVASGGRRWDAHIEARAIRRRVIEAGVPAAAVLEELVSLSTRENAVCSAAILHGLGARRAAVVTCPWHMARALACFRRAGVEAVPFPTRLGDLSPGRRAYLQAHEAVCRGLDARAMATSGVLAASAARFAAWRGPVAGGDALEVDA